MKYLTTILFALTSSFLGAQSDFTLDNMRVKDSTRGIAGLWFEQSFNSNAINNSIPMNLAVKNGPTYQSIQNIRNRLQSSNRAGYTGTERVFYGFNIKNKRDSVNSSAFVSVYTNRQITTRFGKDPIRLLVYGNKEFAGKKANIENLDLLLQQTTFIQFGYTMEKNNRVLGIAPSLAIGNKYVNVSSEEGFLYTSPIGDSLYAEARGSFSQADTGSKLIFDPNGIGAAIDLYFKFPFDVFRKNEQQGNVTVEVNNLGFMVWNKNTFTYKIDGNYAWGGFSAPNLFDLNDSIIDSQRPNDVQSSFIDRTEFGTVNMLLPFRLSLRYEEQLNDKVLFVANLQQQFMAHSLPFLGLSQEIRMNKLEKKTAVHLNFFESLGGYNYIGLGSGISVSNDHLNFIVGTRNLIGLTNTEYFSGFNVHMGFNWKFY